MSCSDQEVIIDDKCYNSFVQLVVGQIPLFL